ncbi:MAG: nucleoside triphosphate pyrophosphohydrolase [Spirochaetales bacterium]|nr:nucleoside triphosphate pyrophosphohydrolase [Spirochaetales bacterium]
MDEYKRLLEIIIRLRAPDGCPWDRKQTAESIVNNLIEEAYETSDAIISNNIDDIKEEIGDIYLVATMLSVIYQEQGLFDYSDPIKTAADKLFRRHPHVFGEAKADNPDEVMKIWQAEKEKEKKQDSIDTGIPGSLPSLLKAFKLQKKAAAKGFDWESHDIDGVFDKIHEEIDELKAAVKNNDAENILEECGDMLFSAINICRFLKVDPHLALEKSNLKFIRRFNYVNDNAGAPLNTLTLHELDKLWQEAKLTEKK